jgi:hypothetical protein
VKTKEDELAPVPLLLSKLKSQFKLLFRSKFRSLVKNEWMWRLFVVLQVVGIIGIIYLSTNNPDWHLFPHDYPDDYHTDGPYWDYLNSRYWTEDHENWFVTAFLFGPFLLTKAMDWIFEAKKKTLPFNSWKNN